MKMRLFCVQLLAGALILDNFTAFQQGIGGVNAISVTTKQQHHLAEEANNRFTPMMAELQSEKDGDTGLRETVLSETNNEVSNEAAWPWSSSKKKKAAAKKPAKKSTKKPKATKKAKPAAAKKLPAKRAAYEKLPAKQAAYEKVPAKQAKTKKTTAAKPVVSVKRLQKRNNKIEKVQDQKQDLRMKLMQANKDKAQLQKEVKSLLAMSESTLGSMDKTSQTFAKIIESITQKFNVIAKQADAVGTKAGTPQKPAQAKKVPQAKQNTKKQPAQAPTQPAKQPAQPDQQPAQNPAPAAPAPAKEEDPSIPAPAKDEDSATPEPTKEEDPATPEPAKEEDKGMFEKIGDSMDDFFGL